MRNPTGEGALKIANHVEKLQQFIWSELVRVRTPSIAGPLLKELSYESINQVVDAGEGLEVGSGKARASGH